MYDRLTLFKLGDGNIDLVRRLARKVDTGLATKPEPGPGPGLDTGALTDQHGELGVGELQVDVVLLYKVSSALAGGALLAHVEPQLLNPGTELESLLRSGSHISLKWSSHEKQDDKSSFQ